MGRICNEDDDDNDDDNDENLKTSTGLPFFADTARLQRETSYFHVCIWTQDDFGWLLRI